MVNQKRENILQNKSNLTQLYITLILPLRKPNQAAAAAALSSRNDESNLRETNRNNRFSSHLL
jgi:hypothetical protein